MDITIKHKSGFLPSILFIFLLSHLIGCATVPVKDTVPTYTIAGTQYYPLVKLCDDRNIVWQYDTFSRTIVLNRGTRKMNLRAGDSLALVDDQPVNTRHPVEIYEGTIVIPATFKKEVFDTVFTQRAPTQLVQEAPQKLRKVVIDAGHGGFDPGAIGRSGLREKDVNLDIAKRLAILLRQAGIEVEMTRTTDKFIPLPKRVSIANSSGADLFVSIHSNAARVRSLNGFEVYYVSNAVNDSKRALSAARSCILKLDGASFAGSSQALKATLWDMIYTQARAESIELSRSICLSIDDDLDTRVLGIKGAGFQVLRGANIPAVLIETGFLSNSTEECRLKNSYYRQKVAEAVANGITSYGRKAELVELAHK